MTTNADRTEFDELERVVAHSHVVRIVAGTADRLRDIAQRSTVLSAMSRIRWYLGLLSRPKIIRSAGILLATFAVTQATFTVIVPMRSAAAVPALAWLVVAGGAALIIAAARPLSVAWSQKREGRRAL